jgi:hypothetical protein
MSAQIDRIIIPDSQLPNAWALASGYADALVKKHGAPLKEVVLLNHTKAQLSTTGLAGWLGKNADVLNKGGTVRLQSGANLTATTLRSISQGQANSIIIACYADEAMMLQIDGLGPVAGVIAVPDLSGGIDRWKDRWNPIVHGQASAAPVQLIADPKVEGAMQSLTKGINLGNGVLGPRDKESVDEVLRILRAKGHSESGSQLQSWAIQNGWQTGAAAELGRMATKIFGLQSKPNLAKFNNVDARYAAW